jgi:hypothetical protein
MGVAKPARGHRAPATRGGVARGGSTAGGRRWGRRGRHRWRNMEAPGKEGVVGAHLSGLSPMRGGVEDGWRCSTAQEVHGHRRWPWWAPAMRRRTRRRRGPSVWSFSRGREARRGERGGAMAPPSKERGEIGPAQAHEEEKGESSMGQGGC